MPHIQIRSRRSGEIICAGEFPSMIECLEHSASSKQDLSDAELSGQNLSNANLDGIIMRGANLGNVNLTGANLSEADLSGCDLRNAVLCNACLCEAELSACDFSGALFGATDIANAVLSSAVFSTLSALDLDFRSARTIDNCRFVEPGGTLLPFSSPPIVIKGLLHTPVVILGHTVKIGSLVAPLEKTIPLMQAILAEVVKGSTGRKGTDFFALFDNHG